MNWTILFHEAAENEMNEAADFYDLQHAGLGTAFLDEIRTAISNILKWPEATPTVQGSIRKKNLVRFPFSFCIMRFGKTRYEFWRSHIINDDQCIGANGHKKGV